VFEKIGKLIPSRGKQNPSDTLKFINLDSGWENKGDP
tara:strand:- start:6499 stop:6609 length:111 start_codon:yes stop_codon:yes gene_type:complete